MKNIPVAHCFDNNYVIPAAVAFTSMLRYASKNYFYNLYVMHNGIAKQNQARLCAEVKKFSNASLEFIDMEGRFSDLFDTTKIRWHYTKEMYYKFLLSEIFPQYEKIIVTDVDVLYRGDISREFENFNVKDDYFLAGCNGPGIKNSWLENNSYDADFSEEERKNLKVGAGYLIFNLKKMRECDIQKKFIDFACKNAHRIRQPEQDTINLVSSPKIKILPYGNMVCTYLFDLLKTDEDFSLCYKIAKEDVKRAMQNPVQVHYATGTKPWNTPACAKSDLWYFDLAQTDFFYDHMLRLEYKCEVQNASPKNSGGGGVYERSSNCSCRLCA